MKKSKRINPLEQHFEKLVLGAVSVVLLGVVAMQFLTQPNAVKVGSNPDPVPPDRVFESVRTEAEQLLAKMRSVEPDLPEVPEQNVAERFEQVRTLAAGALPRIERIGESAKIGELAGDTLAGADAATIYALPALPVPEGLAAASFRATVDPIAWATNEELRPYLPDNQPFDLTAVSVEGLVSGVSLSQSLQTDPEGAVQPLPLQWWRGNVQLLGIEVERQELGPDGQWTDGEVIAGGETELPVLREARREGITPVELTQISQQAQGMKRQLVQPQFPPTIAGAEWIRPSEMQADAGLSEQDVEKNRLKRRVEFYDRRIAGKQKQLEEIGGSSDFGEDRGIRGGGRRGEGGAQPATRDNPDRDQQQREQIQKAIEADRRERQKVVDQLAALGVFIDEDPSRTQQQAQPEPPLPEILEAEDMPVWVHDLAAEPGKTYRYRMRVVLNNPLFGRALYLADSQQEAAKSPVLEGEWSPWTNPVPVEDNRHFFVVSASESDQIGSQPRAAVEVYEFYYGYWRKASTTLEPGDTVHARAKLPDSLLIWDPAKLEELAKQPAQGRQPFRGIERDPGGGRYAPPGNERGLRGREFGGEDPAPGAGQEQELPPGATPGPKSLDLSLPAMLLDVVRLPGPDGQFQAVLRGTDGRVTVRNANDERATELYKRLSANAREGETQGQPEPEPQQARPDLPANERRREEEGGGGGGGG